MKFMNVVKSSETSGPPPQALMDAIAKLAEEAASKGVMVEMGGLMPSAMGARIRVAGGKITVTDGPFAESREVIGGYAILDVPSKEDAVYWTRRFMEAHRDHCEGWEGETEIRQIFEAAPVEGAKR